jgi:F0F1-type ATP synthase assembly protein I
LIDLRSWPKKWNEAGLRDIAILPENSGSRPWPLIGMLAIGLVAGAAFGGYAVSQRNQMKRLAKHAHRMGDELAAMASEAATEPMTTRSNHRRKATSEV